MKKISDDTKETGHAAERQGEPCRLVREFASKMVKAAGGLPILDVACGSGRNALPFIQHGCAVICVDRDLTLLDLALRTKKAKVHEMDLMKDVWPFDAESVGAIINVHFFLPSLLTGFERSLSPGGYLLLQTIPGCGGNYRELPKAGAIRTALRDGFDFELYRERRVGPPGFDAVTVQLVAKRRKQLNRGSTVRGDDGHRPGGTIGRDLGTLGPTN